MFHSPNSPLDRDFNQGELDNSLKPPRTVHIDVYCTASDAEDENSNSLSSLLEQTIPSTVLYETDNMLLQHKNAGMKELPRKLAPTIIDGESLVPKLINIEIGGSIDKSNQIQRDNLSDQAKMRKLHAMRNLSQVMRDVSNDTVCSGYPNSSLSTFRDATFSSISSAMASSSAVFEGTDFLKEADEIAAMLSNKRSFLNKCEDRPSILRSNVLNHSETERNFTCKQNSHINKRRTQSNPSDSNDSSDDGLQEFIFHDISRMKNASSKSLDISNAESAETVRCFTSELMQKQNNLDLESELSINLSSPFKESQTHILKAQFLDFYSNDYLTRARKFGTLIRASRKPGHHIGPVRNPECLCEHCQRWLQEREHFRERAVSVGDLMTMTRLLKWKRGENVD